MAIQLQELRNKFGRLKKDISDVDSATFFDWCNYVVYFIWDKILETSPDKFFKMQNINVVAGQSTYALPADLDQLSLFNSGIFEVNNGQVQDIPINYTGFGASTYGYYLEDTNLIFTPIPQQNRTYLLRYLPPAPTFTALTDYFTFDKSSTGLVIVPDQYVIYLIRALDVFYENWDEEMGVESFADARFVRALNDILSHIRISPKIYYLENQFDAF